ncbi:synaptonemal complex protein 2-like [Centroberyx gerrardi]
MLELRMEDCLQRSDSTTLVSLLYEEGLSALLVTRLDQVVTKELSQAGFSRISLLLKAVGIVSEKTEDLELLLRHGLGTKESVRDLLTSDLHKNSAPALSLTEEFYDYFLVRQ